jgi:hypothetical protein
LTELGHVDGAQPKTPSSRVSAGFVPEPPFDVLEAEWPEQHFVAIAEEIVVGRCGHDCIGNRGVAIALVVSLPRLVNKRWAQGESEAVGGPIDRMAVRIFVVVEP